MSSILQGSALLHCSWNLVGSTNDEMASISGMKVGELHSLLQLSVYPKHLVQGTGKTLRAIFGWCS